MDTKPRMTSVLLCVLYLQWYSKLSDVSVYNTILEVQFQRTHAAKQAILSFGTL